MTARTLLGLVAAAVTTPAPAAGPDAPPPSGKYWVYLGTYTGGKGSAPSKGIYRAEFDLASGKLSAPELAAEMTNPSFLTLSPNGKALYAVSEGNGGSVTAFQMDPTTGGLTKLNEKSTLGAGPCHASTSPDGTKLAVANYTGGNWVAYRLIPDGQIRDGNHDHHLPNSELGPTKPRQNKPYAHCTAFDPTGKFLYVADLGSDIVRGYKLMWQDPAREGTPTTGSGETIPIRIPAGAGPRHIHISPSGDVAYVNGELDSTIHVVKLNRETGAGEVVQSLSTLPEPVKRNSTAEVRIHPSGKFVYVSNRGHNSVAVFRVDTDTGKLTAAGHATSADVKVPRNFNIDPTGKWMLVASQDADNVAVFAIDPETGLPKATGEKVAVGKPVCVKFLPKP